MYNVYFLNEKYGLLFHIAINNSLITCSLSYFFKNLEQ